MQTRKIDNVRKRDGRIVPYDESKIADAIHRAACSVGIDNKFLSQDLAGVVTMYLERYYTREVPESREIREMVEKIIMDTGNAKIARAFILHGENRWREGTRERREPAGAAPQILFPEDKLLVSPMTRDEVTMWGREKIASALVKEAGIPEPMAGEIAAAVEEKILRAGMKRISTSIIRELVDSELFQRGYGTKLRKQLIVGLPKYDLRRLMGDEEREGGGERPDPERLCLTIGESTLRQYALQEVFSREVADAHLEGRIHIHHLEHPLKLSRLAPDVRTLGGGDAVRLPSAARVSPRSLTWGIDLAIRQARKYVVETVELRHVNTTYAAALDVCSQSEMETEAEFLASALSQPAESPGKGRPIAVVGIDIDGAHPNREGPSAAATFGLEILRALRRRSGPRCAGICPSVSFRLDPSLKGDEADGALLPEACRFASEFGRSLFVFQRVAYAAPSTARDGDRWSAVAQTVSINLPQVVYRSEINGRDVYAEMDDALALAVDAHRQKSRLLRRTADAGDPTSGRHHGWIADGRGAADPADVLHGIAVAGLHEAVTLLQGHSYAKDDQAVKLALRIMSYLHFRVKEEAGKHRLRLSLEDASQEDAIDRFARIDVQMYPRARGIPRDNRDLLRYSPGFHCASGSVADPVKILELEGRFQTLIETGSAELPRDANLYDLVLDAVRKGTISRISIR